MCSLQSTACLMFALLLAHGLAAFVFYCYANTMRHKEQDIEWMAQAILINQIISYILFFTTIWIGFFGSFLQFTEAIMQLHGIIILSILFLMALLNFALLHILNNRAEQNNPYRSKRLFKKFENYFLLTIYTGVDLDCASDFYQNNHRLVLLARANFFMALLGMAVFIIYFTIK